MYSLIHVLFDNCVSLSTKAKDLGSYPQSSFVCSTADAAGQCYKLKVSAIAYYIFKQIKLCLFCHPTPTKQSKTKRCNND